jgi:hypothetical protein
MIKAMTPRRGLGGALFYEQMFSVVLLFGLTELKAQLSWMEDVSTSSALCYPFIYLVSCRVQRSGKDSVPMVPSICLIAMLAEVLRKWYMTWT